MEKHLDSWTEISRLIAKEKETALAEFRSMGFDPAATPAVAPRRRSFGLPVRYPAFLAAAASLLLAVGLALFLLLRGSWQTTPVARGLDDLLAGSFLSEVARGGDADETGNVVAKTVASLFTALATAGLKHAAAEAPEPFDPSTPVERGDPGQVRKKIGAMIRSNAIELLLARFHDFGKEV